ncbi:MAG: hypothetical protein WCA15_22805 [Candidatus Acidiferrales bacterium]
MADEAAAYKKAQDIANAPTAVPVSGPHARLVSMVQGLALGLDAFGKSIATHGKEGGAEEVTQVQAQQQQQKIQAQQAAQAQKNQQIQNALTIGSTNHALGQSYLLLSTLPTDLALNDLRLPEAQAKLAADKTSLAQTQAEFQSQYGISPDQFTAMMSGTSAADPNAVKNLTGYAQQKLDAASKILKSDDPSLVKAQAVLADPKSAPQDVFGAISAVNREIGLQGQVSKAQEAKDQAFANSPVGKLSTPAALAEPGATAAIQAAIDNPNTDAKDIPTLRSLLPKAAAASFAAETLKAREQRNQQIISQGDPDAAGKLLASRTLTLDELKSRSVTPQFIASAVQAAQKYDPTFKAPEAAAQARIAASPSNAQFFGNTDSLLVKGGTLDQLDAAAKALGNTKIPKLNTVENWKKAETGQGSVSAFATAALGVADDASKVLSGGVGSDTARQEVLDLISRNASPTQISAAITQIRKQIQSQRNGRVSTNPYLKDMFPDPATRQETPGVSGTQPLAAPPANATGKARATDGNWYYHDGQGNNLGKVQ